MARPCESDARQGAQGGGRLARAARARRRPRRARDRRGATSARSSGSSTAAGAGSRPRSSAGYASRAAGRADPGLDGARPAGRRARRRGGRRAAAARRRGGLGLPRPRRARRADRGRCASRTDPAVAALARPARRRPTRTTWPRALADARRGPRTVLGPTLAAIVDDVDDVPLDELAAILDALADAARSAAAIRATGRPLARPRRTIRRSPRALRRLAGRRRTRSSTPCARPPCDDAGGDRGRPSPGSTAAGWPSSSQRCQALLPALYEADAAVIVARVRAAVPRGRRPRRAQRRPA